ncbi:MAG: ATP-grasp domain-containing protein [Theionarchaea archaeon]|nr:ATP-grasp domain-containing protein [Theionarchaea archaeon]
MKYVLAGLSTRAVAESAVRAGKDCVAVDFFGDLDLESVCRTISLRRRFGVSLGSFSPYFFLRGARLVDADCLIFVSPLENYPHILQRFSECYEIIGNNAETVKKVREWKSVCQVCSQHNIKVPRTCNGHNYIVKPKKSGGGMKIHRLSSYVIQELVKGEPYSVSFLGDGENAQVLSVNEQLIGRGEFGAREFWYCGNITPGFPGEHARAVVDSMCTTMTRHFGLKGSCGIDFVVDPNGNPYVMEINPRPQATLELLERVYGRNMVVLHENAVRGILDVSSAQPSALRTWGKAIVYAERNITMPDTSEWLFYSWIKDIPHPAESILKSEPICTVVADGSDRDDCFEHLVQHSLTLKGFFQ